MKEFTESIVNQRFKAIYQALENFGLIKGKSDIAKHLGTYNHVVNSILKGNRNITVEQLNKLFDIFGIDANYVFGNSDTMFLEGREPEAANIPTRSFWERNTKGRQNITLVPNRALAGYATEHHGRDYLENLQKFGIPGLEGNDLVAFEISGDSMTPTITNGDFVVCEEVERGQPLRDNHVYVIVTDVVVAKRIQQLKNSDSVTQLRLISDNGNVYKPYDVDLEDIRQILKVKSRITNYAIS